MRTDEDVKVVKGTEAEVQREIARLTAERDQVLAAAKSALAGR